MRRILTIQQYKKMSRTFVFFFVTILVANPAVTQAQQINGDSVEIVRSEIQVQRKRRGIDAELVDQGDYYMHPDGRQIRMLRKKDVYVIESDDTDRSMQRVKAQYGERVKDVDGHLLGGRKVVKIDNGQAVKRRRNEQFDVSAQMLKSSDNSIRNLKPVFANEQGDSDILLVPKLTVKLVDGIDPTAALNRLDSRYGLELDRKLRVSGNVYSLSLKVETGESQQFALVRRVMNDVMVEWAEPQFIAKAEKTTFEPNDMFFDNQWHLRNTGQSKSRCDTDCDANNAWDINIESANGSGGNGVSPSVTGTGMVIAIIDDGVQLDHEDLNIKLNGGEKDDINSDECPPTPDKCNNGIDDDGNGFVDDWSGWDFVVDSIDNPLLENASGTDDCGVDGYDQDAEPLSGYLFGDNNPSPQATSDCTMPANDGGQVENDDHGTAVAGLAAGIGNNGQGVAGTAYNAEILPIRLISDFNTELLSSVIDESFCNRAAEAMEYAGAYADVINNSWSMPVICLPLETAISNVTSGNVDVNGGELTSKRPNGSPVLFASGNQASGWVKVSIPVTAGEHAYEWRFLRNGLNVNTENGDQVWIDDITWPDGSSEGFEGADDLEERGFELDNVSAGNSCIAGCVDPVLGDFFFDAATWSITASPEPIITGTSQAALIDGASPAECSNTYLYMLRDEPSSGLISFWVWVDADTSGLGLNVNDNFEFLIDGVEELSFGDENLELVNGTIAYPASLSGTIDGVISVGASNSGDLSGDNTASLTAETRAFYSQYGPNLDVVAPSDNQQLAIVTTDRYDPNIVSNPNIIGNADGYNNGSESIGNDRYTNTFGGTSASTPIVAGVAAAMLAVDTNLTANGVRTILRNTADKIGGVAYSSGRNDFYGYGRVNMYLALIDAANITNGVSYSAFCDSANEAFSFISAHNIFEPEPLFFCPAIGEVPEDDDFCIPIKVSNGNIAVICL